MSLRSGAGVVEQADSLYLCREFVISHLLYYTLEGCMCDRFPMNSYESKFDMVKVIDVG